MVWARNLLTWDLIKTKSQIPSPLNLNPKKSKTQKTHHSENPVPKYPMTQRDL